MYESTCKCCGAPMFARYKNEMNRFCSKACYQESLHWKTKAPEDDGTPRSRYIHPEGYTNLVCAIVKRARQDIMMSSPGTHFRMDAESFFESGYFESITGMDGRKMLSDIRAEYNRRHKKGARPR